jgi:hypothetical protein
VPVPPDRPFSLGEPQPMPDLRRTTNITAVARPGAIESAALQPPDQSAGMTPEASAYASSRRDPLRAELPGSFMSGHSLY